MFDWPDWGNNLRGVEKLCPRVYFWAYLPDRVIGLFF
jgi:hypothetical protein